MLITLKNLTNEARNAGDAPEYWLVVDKNGISRRLTRYGVVLCKHRVLYKWEGSNWRALVRHAKLVAEGKSPYGTADIHMSKVMGPPDTSEEIKLEFLEKVLEALENIEAPYIGEIENWISSNYVATSAALVSSALRELELEGFVYYELYEGWKVNQ